MRDVARVVRRHRALLAGGLTAGAVAVALPVVAPDPPPTVDVVVAARDLGPGLRLAAGDLAVVPLPRSLAPRGVLTRPTAAVGHAVVGRVRRGEPLTDVRLLGAGLVGDDGLVAAPVRLADPATAALLHAGDRVDVLAASPEADGEEPARVLAQDLRVLAVPAPDDADGALVVLAVTPEVAARLAGASAGSRLSVTVLAS